VRTLEQYSAIQSRRGRYGGVFVTAPDPSRVTELAVKALRRAGATGADCRLLLAEFRALAFDLASDRQDALSELAERIESDREGDEIAAATRLCRALVEASGNRALGFAVQLLECFDAIHAQPSGGPVAAVGRAFLDSMKAGDLNRARRALILFSDPRP
jgi:DNA-binding FadR family transcriptional regulator